jgi:uncharacterized membrane protein HdeD (DUF308 family)
MQTTQQNGLTFHFHKIDQLRKTWGWFLALGILLVILGCFAIAFSYYTTIFSVVIFGVVLFAAGVVQIVQAFLARQWSGLFLSLLLGILYVVTGFICLAKPGMAAVALTLWIAAFCFIAGIFKMATALISRFSQWGWVFFNGLITFLLGVIIFSEWPISGLWVIGLFVGIDLLLDGWTWILLSLGAKRFIENRLEH